MTRPTDELGDAGIDPFIEAYEAAQARDGHARLADYLPVPGHPLYLTVLCELVRVDLEYGWMRGSPRPLDDYRAEYPSLFRDPERSREVAFEESRLRRQARDEAERAGRGERPPGEDLEDAARLYRRHRHDSPARLSEVFASYAGPREHSALFLGLHDSEPETAGRLADALSALPRPGTDFAGFRLVRELGRGAFGRVYLAEQGGLAGRPVALKVSAELAGETQTLARLQHTHIVPIYSAHRVGPLRALCMPYLGATTLAGVLRGLKDRGVLPRSGEALVEGIASGDAGDATPVEGQDRSTAALRALRGLGYVQAVLWIGARLADGLAHAHERGIVHRDLKPANVLLTDEGQPMLLDFNLAADVNDPSLRAAALVGGTLPYMAPEQLEALRDGPRPRPADARADLYALGLILHELLTGRHPFPVRRGAVDEVVPLMIGDRRGPPPSARPGNAAVSPAADSILRRCLEPDPDRRYQDARQLLDDLQRQLDDRPLRHAPDPSPRERLAKWARRHPRLSSSTTLGVAALALVAALVASHVDQQRRFGPIGAAHALRQLADAHEDAGFLLFDPALRDEGIALCRRALAPYGDLESPSWRAAPLVADLTDAGRAELGARAGELLLLWARGLALEAAGAGPADRAGLVRDALRRNELAESCFAPGGVPRALWVQRGALARLAGDGDEVRRADARAAATPLRSARDYGLLALEDPEAAASREVLSALGEASRRDPRDLPVWMTLGHLHALRGRLGEADACFTVAIALRPGSPWPYFHRGRVSLERQDHQGARLDFDRSLRLRPRLGAARINRAIARLGLGDHAGAVEDLTEALAGGATETRLYFLRARAREQAGDREGAARDRAEGLRLTPRDAESWTARGLARLPDDPAGALADIDRALELEPRSRPALQSRAAILAEALGRTEEAIGVLDRVVALYPDFVPARVGRGVLLARLGRRPDALRDAEESRRRDPTSPDTNYRAACIYALTSKAEPGDRATALRLLAEVLGEGGLGDWARAARTDPDLAALHDQDEFRALLRAGRPEPAGRPPPTREFSTEGRTAFPSVPSLN